MSGTRLARAPGFEIIARSAVAVPLANPGHTNETVLATISLPPPGPKGIARVRSVWSYTNSGNNKILRGRLNNTLYTGVTMTTSATYRMLTEIECRDAENAQFAPGTSLQSYGLSTAAMTTSTHDWTSALNFTLTAQLALGTETITLESWLAEMLRG